MILKIVMIVLLVSIFVGGAVKMAVMDPLYGGRVWYPKFNQVAGKVMLALTAALFQDLVIWLLIGVFE